MKVILCHGIAVFLLVLACIAGAQSTSTPTPTVAVQTATLSGAVLSGDGVACEGAQVTITTENAAHGAVGQVTTDAAGRFQMSDLPAGRFRLSINAPGFSPRTIAVLLNPGDTLELPTIELAVGANAQEVQVHATLAEIAQQQLKDEEKQRVLGVVPNFNVVYAKDAPALNSRQKFELTWKSLIDPFTLGITVMTAGIEQAADIYPGYGQGAAGFGRRLGAAYGDNAIGTLLGSAILPVVFHQDPRYFYKGTGTKISRVFYAIANSVICKGDNGRWQPNYSRITAGLAAGAISNLYYPAGNRNGYALIIESSAISKATGAAQNILQEFLIPHLTHGMPSYGKNAQ